VKMRKAAGLAGVAKPCSLLVLFTNYVKCIKLTETTMPSLFPCGSRS
jgi:hypothetical protein